jgi:hypothetical protein
LIRPDLLILHIINVAHDLLNKAKLFSTRFLWLFHMPSDVFTVLNANLAILIKYLIHFLKKKEIVNLHGEYEVLSLALAHAPNQSQKSSITAALVPMVAHPRRLLWWHAYVHV